MKELGHFEYYLSTDKTNWVRNRGSFYYTTRYLEPSEDKYQDWSYEEIDYDATGWRFWTHEPWLFNKKEYKEISYFCGDDPFRVYPGQRLYEKVEWCKNEYSNSFDSLSKDMDAEEFVEYLKDHGMTVCPLK